jgi:hypothetical protein
MQWPLSSLMFATIGDEQQDDAMVDSEGANLVLLVMGKCAEIGEGAAG